MPSVIWLAVTTISRDDAITETNGIMVVDWDHVGSEAKLNLLRERTKADPHVITSFETPRENRFKATFLTDVTDATIYQTAYYLLLDKLRLDEVYGQFKPDPSSSNVSRCQFVPYDPLIHHNPDPIPMELDTLARAAPYYSAAFTASDDYLFTELEGFQRVVIKQEGRPEKHLVLVETPDKKSSILKRLVKGRLSVISRHLRDEDVEAALMRYGASKQAYRTFCKGLETQLFYAQLRKEAKDPVLLGGMMSSFKIGKEYPRNEALRKLKRLQKSAHLFKGINLDGKRLVYYLRRFFQVEFIIGNGKRTSYKIISKNVIAYELDIPKIRRHTEMVVDYEY